MKMKLLLLFVVIIHFTYADDFYDFEEELHSEEELENTDWNSEELEDTNEDFLRVYPMSSRPDIRIMLPFYKDEVILFEANPVIQYNFFNDFVTGFVENQWWTKSFYVTFKPQIRMYNESSSPVKMPSYRVLLGWQNMFMLETDGKNQAFWGISLESGHYSNGQSGCTYSEGIDDESPQCADIYSAITPETDLSAQLNRVNGNFSTNLTELILNYRYLTLEDTYMKSMLSASLGCTIYHKYLFFADVGGISDHDKEIYPQGILTFALEAAYRFKESSVKISLENSLEVYLGAHESVTHVRNETRFTCYPLRGTKELGFFAGIAAGHDNYNARFVDSGYSLFTGITWNPYLNVGMKQHDI